MQVKCPPYGGVNPTMTVYYAQNGDAELTLYKEIATISTAGKIIYEFNEEGISADYWVVRFTSSGWIDLRLCSPIGLFTTGLYTKECYQQIMDRVNGSTSVGNYALKSDIGNGTITIKKNGTSVGSFTTNQSNNKDINLTINSSDIPDVVLKSTDQTITGTKDFNAIRRHSPYLYLPNGNRLVKVGVKADGTLYVNNRNPKSYSWDVKYLAS